MPATVVPITPMAWRRDVVALGEPVFPATFVSSSGIIEVPVDGPSLSLSVGQREDIQRLPIVGTMDVLQHGHRLVLGTAAAKPRSDGDILLAVDAEGYRIALHRRAQPHRP